MNLVPGNAQHIGSRSEQQDSFGFSDPENESFVAEGGLLAVVADGAGGMEHGQEASRVAVKAFLESYQQKANTESIAAALERSLRAANDAVVGVAEEQNSTGNVASTLVAAVLHDHRLHWISVGDSALYLYRNHTLSLLTTSHVYARQLDREAAAGIIQQTVALNHPDRDALTSYLGKEILDEVDENPEPVPLGSGDRVVLATDGLFKTLSEDEIAEALGGANPQAACEELVRKTLERGRAHQDNVTVVCLEVRAPQDSPIEVSGTAKPHRGFSAWFQGLFSRGLF